MTKTNMKRIIHSLRDGDRVIAKIVYLDIEKEVEGVISYDGWGKFLCQNEVDGVNCREKKGYLYSWLLMSMGEPVSSLHYISPTKKDKQYLLGF
jgi:hypothetical protein